MAGTFTVQIRVAAFRADIRRMQHGEKIRKKKWYFRSIVTNSDVTRLLFCQVVRQLSLTDKTKKALCWADSNHTRFGCNTDRMVTSQAAGRALHSTAGRLFWLLCNEPHRATGIHVQPTYPSLANLHRIRITDVPHLRSPSQLAIQPCASIGQTTGQATSNSSAIGSSL